MSYDTDVLVLGWAPAATPRHSVPRISASESRWWSVTRASAASASTSAASSKALLHLAEALGEIEGLAEKGITPQSRVSISAKSTRSRAES